MEPIIARGLCLRPFESVDIPAFVEAARESHGTVGRWMPWCVRDYSPADAKAWFALTGNNREQGVACELGIFTMDGKNFLGGIGLNQFNREHNFCNLGFWTRESRQRQGIAPRAAGMLAEYGFSRLGLTRIEIVVDKDNIPSCRVALKIGSTFECIARNRLYVDGRARDAAVYSLVPEQCIS